MPRAFAIGDIHGCSKTFRKLLTEEIRIQPTDIIYCVGDYIDRGPDSKGVIDFILELRNENYNIRTLRGNHEQMMLDSVKSNREFLIWMRNGGAITLQSFGANSFNELATDYQQFFLDTEFYIEAGNYIFVHAGLNFDTSNPLADTTAMMWTRETYVDENWLNGRTIVHGHTPVTVAKIESQLNSHAINIDGGCVYLQYPGMAKLVALDLEQRQLIVTDNIDLPG